LAGDLDRSKLQAMTSEVALAEVIDAAPAILEGRVRGRIVVKIG
jgi:acrylyl-CoA reductase (NADPH)